jgi:hypothetical protein
VSTLDQNEKLLLRGQVLDRVTTDKAFGRDTARHHLVDSAEPAKAEKISSHYNGPPSWSSALAAGVPESLTCRYLRN